MLEAGSIAAVVLALVGSAAVLRRTGSPTGYWLAGWTAGALAGVLPLVDPSAALAPVLAAPLAAWLPFMLLAGALALRGRRPPDALFAAALATGVARAALAVSGRLEASYLAGLAVEPAVVLAAAWHCHRAREQVPGATRHLLGPTMLALVPVSGVHLAVLSRTTVPPLPLVAFWLIAGPVVLGVQLQAASARGREALRRARDELERRVGERTAELERAVASLRSEVERHRRTAERLRESEERYRTVSELSSDFSFALRVHPARGICREWITGAFERITGRPPEAIEGWDFLELFAAEEREDARALVAGAHRGGAHALERRIVAADGQERWLSIELVSVRDAEDGTLRVIGAARDRSAARATEAERRALERRMEDAQRIESLGMLTGGIAHDFNNLLAVVLGNTRMLLDDLGEDAPAAGRLLRVRAAAEHAARLTEQMLTYSGKAAVSLSPCDLSALVRDMSELLSASVADGCRLVTHLSAGAVVEGDETRLRQVVLNLVTNASEALAEGHGAIDVHTGRLRAGRAEGAGWLGCEALAPGEYVSLDVVDDGKGIGSEEQRRIFEPFYTTKFSGRGLGLASVLGIVRAHRGAIRVESEPGRGTRVRVLLPRARAEARAQLPAAPAPEGRGRLLVVDDDPDVLELCGEFLRRAGYEVVTAAGGREAVEHFQEHAGRIDAVVLDLSMPDLAGEDVFLALREIRRDVPVILATGYSEEIAAERFRAAGLASMVRKPYSPEELIGAVRAARERMRAQSAGRGPADPGSGPR